MALDNPQFLQRLGYKAIEDRRWLADFVSEGVVGTSDFLVAQRAAGANMSVDIAAGVAYVTGENATRSGRYRQENDGVMNLAINSNASGLPRIDSVWLKIYDSTHIGGAVDAGALEVLAGTPTSGATKENALGVAGPPSTATLLGYVEVASGAISILTANIRDMRAMALLPAQMVPVPSPDVGLILALS